MELQPIGAFSVGKWDDFLMLSCEPRYSLPFDAWAYFDVGDEEPADDQTLRELESHEILRFPADFFISTKTDKALRKKFGDESVEQGIVGGKTSIKPEFGMLIRRMPED